MQFARFALIGVSNTALTWVIYFLLAGYGHFGRVLANIVAWVISSVWSFSWNRRFTFRADKGNVGGQSFRFVAVNISAIGLSSLIILMLDHRPLWVGQSVATAAMLGWNYLMCSRIVFVARSRGS